MPYECQDYNEIFYQAIVEEHTGCSHMKWVFHFSWDRV